MKFFSVIVIALSAAFATAAPAEAEGKLVARQNCSACVSGQQLCCDGASPTTCTPRKC